MVMSKRLRESLKKQHYGLVGEHSAVQICRWTKKDLIDEGECYKAKFYGISSLGCCQMSPSAVFCQNKCVHCWRAIENTSGDSMKEIKIDNPEEIIRGCIEAQRKLLTGFKGNKKINMEKFSQAQEPSQFAISLTGEPTLYPKLGEFISLLREKGKTSFVVTNGLQPSVLKKLGKEGNLPTQLYISLNTPNEKMFKSWHRSSVKNAWKKFNESLKVMGGLDCRRVIRMTLVKGLNMGGGVVEGDDGRVEGVESGMVEDYVKLIKKANPDFIEVKGFMSVGFARGRKGMGYDVMPTYDEIRDYAERIAIGLSDKGYKILDEHERSRVVLIGKDKNKMKIQKNQI